MSSINLLDSGKKYHISGKGAEFQLTADRGFSPIGVYPDPVWPEREIQAPFRLAPKILWGKQNTRSMECAVLPSFVEVLLERPLREGLTQPSQSWS